MIYFIFSFLCLRRPVCILDFSNQASYISRAHSHIRLVNYPTGQHSLRTMVTLILWLFFFFCLFMATLADGRFQARGLNWSCICGLHPSHSNTGSLTQWAWPGIKPVSSQTLCQVLKPTEPQQELVVLWLFYINFTFLSFIFFLRFWHLFPSIYLAPHHLKKKKKSNK